MYTTHPDQSIAYANSSQRGRFIRRTYMHLLAAVGIFVFLEYLLFQSGLAASFLSLISGTNWLFILGPYMLISWLATRFAHNSQSKASQYLGLGLYIAATSLIFVPMLAFAQMKAGSAAIESAATATGIGFIGLTLIAFTVRTDFSFLGKAIMYAGVGTLVLVVCGSLFGFNLGVYFSVGMVILAGLAILHDTSNIMYHYNEDQYVAASLQLFASVAMMLYYLLRIFSSRD